MGEQAFDIGITKAALAQEVLEFVFSRVKCDIDTDQSDEFTNLVLDVQDIFSDYWDEPELDED